eukprot:scaffold16.g22.t1
MASATSSSLLQHPTHPSQHPVAASTLVQHRARGAALARQLLFRAAANGAEQPGQGASSQAAAAAGPRPPGRAASQPAATKTKPPGRGAVPAGPGPGAGGETKASGSVSTGTARGRARFFGPGSGEMKLVLVVAAALVNDQGQLLLAQRPKGKKLAGLWELPGGKVERDETPEQALVREMREELGIVVEPAHFVPITFASHTYADHGFHLLMPLFACTKWSGEPHGAEGQAVQWVSEAELMRKPMPPADEPLLPAVRVLMQRRLAQAAEAAAAAVLAGG